MFKHIALIVDIKSLPPCLEHCTLRNTGEKFKDLRALVRCQETKERTRELVKGAE